MLNMPGPREDPSKQAACKFSRNPQSSSSGWPPQAAAAAAAGVGVQIPDSSEESLWSNSRRRTDV